MEAQVQVSYLKSLSMLTVGQSMTVHTIVRGCGAQDRLYSLGLRKGAVVTVVRSSRMNGPLLVKVNGSQVAIGRCLAEAIMGEMKSI